MSYSVRPGFFVHTLLLVVLVATGLPASQPAFAQAPPPPADGTESPEAGIPEAESAPAAELRLPIRVIAGRLMVRCEIATRFRRIPANVIIDFHRPCALELHNRAADAIRVDANGGVPITLVFPGGMLEVPGRSHGDEEGWEEITRLYSKELGETAVIAALGSQIFRDYFATLDLQEGFLTLRSPESGSKEPPSEEDGSAVTSITLTNDLVWIPVRASDGKIRSMAIGTGSYDTVIDEMQCEFLGEASGEIGPLQLRSFDFSKYVAYRSEEFIQVHEDGALGMVGLNLLQHFRVEIDRVNRWARFTPTEPPSFPEEDLAFYRAWVEDESEPLLEYLEKYPGSRLAREAAEQLVEFLLDEGAETDEFTTALEWIDKTRIEDLRATEALATMRMLLAAKRPDVAVLAGKLGVESGRKDRYPEAVHKIHSQLGELLLDAGDGDAAWEHLLSAAFGLPDDGTIHLHLGEYYESQERYARAMSRYIQAIVAPESGAEAVPALERVQLKMGGEPLSVDQVDRYVSGKVHNFTAATEFEEIPQTKTGRVVLAELFTNPHFGRKLTEGWRSFAVGGSMAAEGFLSHFPRERVVVLNHQIEIPEPHAMMNPYSQYLKEFYGVDGPVYFKIAGVRNTPGAARWRQAEAAYEQGRVAINDFLMREPQVNVALNARLENGRVKGEVTVTPSEGMTISEGRELRVQVVLAERGVLYPGKAKVVVHRMVVRGALTGSFEGERYRGGTLNVKFDKSLAEIQAENERYLTEFEAAGGGIATRLSMRIDPRQVAVVAFARDMGTYEVLQAAYWENPSEESE